MSSLARPFRIWLRTTVVVVAMASGLWTFIAKSSLAEAPTPDVVADGGQWGNKGGRGIYG